MIFTDMKVKASGPKSNVALAAIGMSPQKWEVGGGTPFVGPSGKIFNEALSAQKIHRTSVYVTNLCEFYIDDNDLYSVPQEIMDREIQRVHRELETVQPNCAEMHSSHASSSIHKRTMEMVTSLQIYRCPQGCHTIFISRSETNQARGDSWTFIPNSVRLVTRGESTTLGIYRLRGSQAYNVPRIWLDRITSTMYTYKSCWKSKLLDVDRGIRDMAVMVRFTTEPKSKEDSTERRL